LPRTSFLPAGRAGSDALEAGARILQNAQFLHSVLDAVQEAVLILNSHRQIVFCNKAFIASLSRSAFREVLGMRPGEALECVNSASGAGCGTTEFCRNCGAARALKKAGKGEKAAEECRITVKDGRALNFRVWTVPLTVENEEFTIFSVMDIGDEKRRQTLERIFFHDVLNTAGTLLGASAILEEVDETERRQIGRMLHETSRRLIEEIKAQRDLAEAESGELVVVPEDVVPIELLQETAVFYRHHDAAKGRSIRIDSTSPLDVIRTDKTIFSRVLGNMVKNALEASKEGEVVGIGASAVDGGVLFWVSNPSVMPDEVRGQVFQRAFSTKGPGRGLGSYSMKLLVERYLGGEVSFVSEESSGTTFTIRLPADLSDS